MRIAEDIQKLFLQKGWTLSLAESCTGGALAAALTAQPGASGYFLGSIVAYTTDLKKEILGVTSVDQEGVVSLKTAEDMALGVQYLTHSDWSISVTGVAGPSGGSPETPVGTAFAAIATKEGLLYSWSLHHHGDRAAVIRSLVSSLLEELLTQAKRHGPMDPQKHRRSD